MQRLALQTMTMTTMRRGGLGADERSSHLLLLDEEGTGDALANGARGEDAAVRAGHRLFVLRHVLAAVLDLSDAGNLWW